MTVVRPRMCIYAGGDVSDNESDDDTSDDKLDDDTPKPH